MRRLATTYVIPPTVAVTAAAVLAWLAHPLVGLIVGLLLGLGAAFACSAITARRLEQLTHLVDRSRREKVDVGWLDDTNDEIGALAYAIWRLVKDDQSGLQAGRERISELSVLVDRVREGLIQVDATGTVLFANVAAGTMFGGRNPIGSTFIRVTRDHELNEALARSLRTSIDQQVTFETLGDHRLITAHISRLPVEPPEVLIMLRDDTEVTRLQNLRRDFVANVSHELRTPLSTIKILTETLIELRESDQEAVGFLTRIDNEVDAMTALVRDLLDLARLESRQGGFVAQPVDAGRLLEDVCDRMSSLADRQRVQLSLVPCELQIVFLGDERRLHQALLNLVRNAIDHTPAGGTVIVRACRQGAVIEMSVQDSGYGIPAEDLPRIWERFFKTDRARTGGGTGLGLAIVKHIVQVHGGTVDAVSELGAGSTFSIRLPLPDSVLANSTGTHGPQASAEELRRIRT